MVANFMLVVGRASRPFYAILSLLWVGMAIITSGCNAVSIPSGSGGARDVIDGNRTPAPTDLNVKTQGEPDDTFEQALVAIFDDNGRAALQGTVASPDDADVFDLGRFRAGDRMMIEVQTPGSALDVTAAVFDNQGRLAFFNDDRNSNSFDAVADFVIRHDSDPYFLLVASSSFAALGAETGTYTVSVQIDGGGDTPVPKNQILLLDFRGGQVNSPTLGATTIVPFDAGAISFHYQGQTQMMKQLIRETVQQNFERFDVTILTSDDPPLDPGVHFSTVFFGGFGNDILGLADMVDQHNQDFCDDAIIYTESFDPNLVFFRVPTVEQMSQAIANVASHEAGHILGLNHVDNDRAIMDTESPSQALIDDQEFMQAVLSRQIAPIGTQDAVLLLTESIGPRP